MPDQSIVDSCNKLFISEIYMNTTLLDGGEGDFAIEIYNPSSVPISLSEYYLLIKETSNAVATIPLPTADSIYPNSTYVISKDNSSFSLTSISDYLTPGLALGNTAMLEFKKGTKVIDRLGDSINNVTSFDVRNFLANPTAYLANYDLNLADFETLRLRRSIMATRGIPDFTSYTSFIGEWAYYFNADMSDLGFYNNICNKPPTIDYVGFRTLWIPLPFNVPTFTNVPLDLIINSIVNGPFATSGPATLKYSESNYLQ
jgi:hypothetical protein